MKPDIKATLLNIFIVAGILLFLGALNQTISAGVNKTGIIYMIAGAAVTALSVTLRLLLKKYSKDKQLKDKQ
ncbi:MAG: hypothetical protein ACOX3U_07070 [Christensenellales bacterium]|jgi:uncharacterized membrane protein